MRHKANPLSLVVVICMFTQATAQVTESFTDGNFTSNPAWNGDTSKFEIASSELWLHAPPVTGTAFLTTPNFVLSNASWEFYCRMQFNPTSSNYCRYYLTTDQSNLNAPIINGYYVELGRINDEISLYKVINGITTRIIDGPDNMLNAVTCTTRIKVLNTAGSWELRVDTTGGTNFTSLGTVNDAVPDPAYYTGMYCKYTSTRSDKFFFDDIHISGMPFTDLTPPFITSHLVSSNVLSIVLNEPVLASDLTPANFSLSNSLTVTSVVPDSLNSRMVHITASNAFTNDVFYTLTVNSIQDLFGNITNSLVHPFVLHIPVQGDIVINEIMADPIPPVGLPNLEWIEIRNNSEYPMDVSNWKLSVGTSIKNIPPYVIYPDEYVLVTNAPDTFSFGVGGLHKIGLNGFPLLSNTGDVIRLLDTASQVIDEVSYSIQWYKDPVKEDGGFTLERINPFDICLAGDNWKAAINPNGGTPAAINSVMDTASVPVQVSVYVPDSIHVLIVFNKWMDPSTCVPVNFNLPGLTSVQVLSKDSVLLSLSVPLQVNVPVYLTLLPGIHDCRGIPIASIQLPVIHYIPSLFDVLIHELMIDETPPILLPAAEYIELKNTLAFPVNTSGWNLTVNGHVYTLGNYTIPADSFLLLVNSNSVNSFPGINVGGIQSFAGLTNDAGKVEVYHSSGLLYHAVPYSIHYYDVDAKNDGGWSLEMIDASRPCIFNRNWTASSDPHGGSPGYANSYSQPLEDTEKPHLLKTGLPAADTILLYFDEPVPDVNASNISISNGLMIQDIRYSSPLLNEYTLTLQSPLSAGTIYFMLPGNVQDCSGNVMAADSIPVSIPQPADVFDIVINEVLFDPLVNCIDYVELYNRSEKAIDMSTLIVGEGDTSNLLLNNYSPIHTKSMLLHPAEYLVVSTDHENIHACYAMQDSTSWWDVLYLPDFTNTSGVVGISTFNQQNLDMFAYNDQMHFSLLNSTDGVSLERLRVDDPTQNSMNWHSASSTTGFGTPGYRNSQASAGVIIGDNFVLDPPIFSPDNDGYQDYVTISYMLENPGSMLSVRVFDQAGRLEKFLVNNEMIGTSGYFTWDGTNDSGGKVNIGIHILYVELIGLNGEILPFKKTVVVAAKI